MGECVDCEERVMIKKLVGTDKMSSRWRGKDKRMPALVFVGGRTLSAKRSFVRNHQTWVLLDEIESFILSVDITMKDGKKYDGSIDMAFDANMSLYEGALCAESVHVPGYPMVIYRSAWRCILRHLDAEAAGCLVY